MRNNKPLPSQVSAGAILRPTRQAIKQLRAGEIAEGGIRALGFAIALVEFAGRAGVALPEVPSVYRELHQRLVAHYGQAGELQSVENLLDECQSWVQKLESRLGRETVAMQQDLLDRLTIHAVMNTTPS